MGVLRGEAKQKGLIFDGVNDYILTNNFALFQTNNPYNITLKIKVPNNVLANNEQYIFNVASTGFGGGRGILFFKDSSGNVFIGSFLAGTSPDIASAYFNINSFVNQVITCSFNFDGSKFTLYVNGVLIPPAPIFYQEMSGTYTSLSNFPTNIGRDIVGFNPYFNGFIADFKIFNRMLSGAEVLSLYSGTIPSGLIADWRFDDRSGFVLTDYSGNANNGTLVNYTAGDVAIGDTNKWIYEFGGNFDDKRKSGILQLNNL